MPEREYYYDDQWHTEPPPPVQPPQPLPAANAGAIRETPSDQAPNPQTREAEPWWWDQNNGSPPAVPLGGGMQGWDWDGTRWWQTPTPGINTGQPQPPPPQPPPGPGGPRGGPGGGGGGGAVPSIPGSGLPGGITDLFNRTPQQTQIQSAYQTALLDYMNRAQQTPSLSDPTLAPQVEVFRVQQQRNQERNRRNVAERAAANNINQSGYQDTQINKGVQEQAFNTAMFNAGLLGGEARKRREELLAALQLAQATGNSEAERELRSRLAQVSAAMQQQGLNLQGQLGFGDLALRALMAQMGNEQFYDQLGINSALSMEQLNQRAVERLGL